MGTTTGQSTDFKGMCVELRKRIKELAEHLKNQRDITANTPTRTADQDTAEMIANLTLAYRHLEDASMRVGKAIQAHEGGVSIYDKDNPERDLNAEVPKV